MNLKTVRKADIVLGALDCSTHLAGGTASSSFSPLPQFLADLQPTTPVASAGFCPPFINHQPTLSNSNAWGSEVHSQSFRTSMLLTFCTFDWQRRCPPSHRNYALSPVARSPQHIFYFVKEVQENIYARPLLTMYVESHIRSPWDASTSNPPVCPVRSYQ